MIYQLFILFTVLAFFFFVVACGVGLLRSYLIAGKGVAVILFMVCVMLFTVLAYDSLNIEIVGCASSCASVIRSYEYMVWIYAVFAVISTILALLYSFLQFGDLVRPAYSN